MWDRASFVIFSLLDRVQQRAVQLICYPPPPNLKSTVTRSSQSVHCLFSIAAILVLVLQNSLRQVPFSWLVFLVFRRSVIPTKSSSLDIELLCFSLPFSPACNGLEHFSVFLLTYNLSGFKSRVCKLSVTFTVYLLTLESTSFIVQ